MIYLTPEQVSTVTKAEPAVVAANWPLVCQALERFGVNGPLTQVGMAATIAAETGDFAPKREKRASRDKQYPLWLAQERYWPTGYYGRGFIQLTWQRNYEEAGEAIGVDLVGSPDLALDPGVAAGIAAWFFKVTGVQSACVVSNWHMVRRLVNGPGYARDEASLARFLRHCQEMARLVEAFNG